MVSIAEENGLGLLPSLFWLTATATDLVDEPRDQWGNPDSRTHAFMRGYVRDVVRRFADSPAIWGWEFGNEYNLDADLPNASEFTRVDLAAQLGVSEVVAGFLVLESVADVRFLTSDRRDSDAMVFGHRASAKTRWRNHGSHCYVSGGRARERGGGTP